MPAFPPGQSNPGAYNVGGAPFGSSTPPITPLSSAFDQWLRNPSPTTERLVDQILTNAGRPSLFQSRGKLTGQLGGDYSALSTAFARAAYTMQAASRNMGRTGPGRQFGGEPRIEAGMAGVAWLAGPAGMSGRLSMPPAPVMYKPDQIGKFIKDIRDASFSEDRTLKRILQLEERVQSINPGAARTAGSIASTLAAARSAGFANVVGSWGAPPGGGAPPLQWGGFRPGGGGPLFPPPPGGGAGGGGGFGSSFALGAGRLRGTFDALSAGYHAALTGPMFPASRAAEFFNPSRPLTDLRIQLSNLTRGAARGSGALQEDLYRFLVPEWGQAPPPQFSQLGITPQRYLDTLGGLGGLRPGMGRLGAGTVTGLRQLELSPGFAGMPEGTTTSLAMMGMRLGMTSASGAGTFPRAFTGTLEEAFDRSLDRSEILRAIKGATESTAQQAIAAPDMSQIVRMFQQMIQLDAPGARTGRMETSLMGGVNQFADRPFANAASASFAMGLVTSRDWSSEAQLKKFFGDEGLARVRASPAGPTALEIIGDKNAPMGDRMYWMARLSRSAGPSTIDSITGQAAGVFPGASATSRGRQWMFAAGGLGVAPEDIAGFQASRGLAVRAGATGPARATLPEDQFTALVAANQITLKSMEDHFNMFGRSVGVFDKAVATFQGFVVGGGWGLAGSLPRPSSGGLSRGWGSGFGPWNWFGGGSSGSSGAGGGAPGAGSSGGGIWGWLGGALGHLNPISSAHGAPLGRSLGSAGALPLTSDTARVIAQSGLPPQMQSLVRGIASKEARGFNVLAGGGRFGAETPDKPGYYGFPQWSGFQHQYQGRTVTSHGAGLFQFEPGTWKSAVEQAHAQGVEIGNFRDPQAQVKGAAFWAAKTYRDATGRDLVGDLKNGTVDRRATGRLATQWAFFQNPQWDSIVARGSAGLAVMPASAPGTDDSPLHQQYAASVARFRQQEARATDNYDPNRTGPESFEQWKTRVHSDAGLTVSRSSAGGSSDPTDPGGMGQHGLSLGETMNAFGVLGRAVRETAEHLHELGHGARRANAGMGGASGARNPPTSPATFQESAAFP